MDIRQMIADLPPGLDRAVMGCLRWYIGKDNAISRADLLDQVSQHIPIQDRQLRLAIHELRLSGVMICSSGGVGGGYYIAADWSELQEYLDREVRSRALDLFEQEKALKLAAEKQWGRYSIQERLPI